MLPNTDHEVATCTWRPTNIREFYLSRVQQSSPQSSLLRAQAHVTCLNTSRAVIGLYMWLVYLPNYYGDYGTSKHTVFSPVKALSPQNRCTSFYRDTWPRWPRRHFRNRIFWLRASAAQPTGIVCHVGMFIFKISRNIPQPHCLLYTTYGNF